MKKFISQLLFLTAFVPLVWGQTPTFYWTFDAATPCSTSNSNTISYFCSTNAADKIKITNNATSTLPVYASGEGHLKVDNTSLNLICTNATSTSNAATIEFWLKLDKTAIFHAQTTSLRLMNSALTMSYNSLQINHKDANGDFSKTQINLGYPVANMEYMADGAWHHYAIVMNGSVCSMYIDANKLPTTTTSITSLSAGYYIDLASPFKNNDYLVNNNALYGFRFTGEIDEMALYTTALPECNIKEHVVNNRVADYSFACGSYTTNNNSPVVAYHAEEFIPDDATSSSGIGNDDDYPIVDANGDTILAFQQLQSYPLPRYRFPYTHANVTNTPYNAAILGKNSNYLENGRIGSTNYAATNSGATYKMMDMKTEMELGEKWNYYVNHPLEHVDLPHSQTTNGCGGVPNHVRLKEYSDFIDAKNLKVQYKYMHFQMKGIRDYTTYPLGYYVNTGNQYTTTCVQGPLASNVNLVSPLSYGGANTTPNASVLQTLAGNDGVDAYNYGTNTPNNKLGTWSIQALIGTNYAAFPPTNVMSSCPSLQETYTRRLDYIPTDDEQGWEVTSNMANYLVAGAGGDACLLNDYNAYIAPNGLPRTPGLYWGKHLATIHGAFRDAMFAQATADLGNSTFANNCSYMAYNMGGTGIYADWAETRNINQYKRGGNVYHYSVSSMYFENPGRIIDHTTGSRAGLRMILNGRKKEIETGDKFFAPYVSAGYNNTQSGHGACENDRVRPSQYLASLKLLSTSGADFFHSFFYIHTNSGCPGTSSLSSDNAAGWIWQGAMPSYSQAAVSHVDDWYFNSELLGMTSTNPDGNLWTGAPTRFVLARKHNTVNKYLVTGAILRLTNTIDPNNTALIGNAPLSDVITVNVDGNNLTFPVRQQGSMYVFDNSTGSPIFYQLDGWHEFKHPWYWNKSSISLEAELCEEALTNNANAYQYYVKTEGNTGLDFSSANVKTGVAMNDCNRNQLTYFINTRDLSANNVFIYADAKLINANLGNSLFSITVEDIASNSIISTDNYVVNAGTYALFERVLNGNTAIALAANKEYKITVTFMDKNVLINKIQVSTTQQTASTGSLCVSSNPNPVVTPNVPLNQQLGTIFTGNTTTNNICYTISTSPASFCIAPNTNQPVVISLSNSSYTCTTNVDIQNVASIITTSASPVCEGVGITLSAPTGTGFTYQWKKNGVNISYPSGMAATYPANYAGDYTVTVTDANACSTTSAVTTVLLNSLPTIDPAGASGFIYYCPPATGVQLTANLPTGAPTVASYDWLISNTHYVDPNNHTNTIFGSYPTQYYLVRANYTNGCSRTSGSRRVQIGTNCRVANPSDEQSIAEELFSAYPNPTSGQLSVELQGMASENGSLKLYNYLGQVVVEQTISLEKGAAQLALDIQKLAPGIYNLVFESQDKKMSKKIVKE